MGVAEQADERQEETEERGAALQNAVGWGQAEEAEDWVWAP